MLTLLNPRHPDQEFPPIEAALDDPDGLLAVGGCLTSRRIINAYRHGIFPWYSPGQPILWWSPNPRLVLFPQKIHISRSLRKTLQKQTFSVTFDTAFTKVIAACAATRINAEGTWISLEMQHAFINLHEQGIAHSVETWRDNQLVGGLYGLALGQVFFGESMFHKQTDASKVAFAHLVNLLNTWNYQLIDCQVRTDHLLSLGAEEIPRKQFQKLLETLANLSPICTAWQCR
jgi:leucyl/phenylalanyl-tRNA---protein transferase